MTSSPTPAVLPDARALVKRLRANADPRCNQHIASLSADAADMIERLTATPPASDAAVPAGSVLVPVEPTEAMIWAYNDCPYEGAEDKWSAMTAAAPKVATNTDTTPRDQFLQAAFGTGRAGTAHMPDGPYMSMQDAADVHASLVADFFTDALANGVAPCKTCQGRRTVAADWDRYVSVDCPDCDAKESLSNFEARMLAMDHMNGIGDPLRVQDERGNPHLHYSGQHVVAAFLTGRASR